jgi:predicted nucleic acid-binding protein
MKLYLDVCCLNRPFDDQIQERIHLEAEAVLLILSRVESGQCTLTSSEVIEFEIAQSNDHERAERVRQLLSITEGLAMAGEREMLRAEQLEGMGFREFDALHLASAEGAGVDIFLSTDDQLLRVASRVSNRLRLRVLNPLSWIREVTGE